MCVRVYYLVHFFPWLSAEVLQREVSDDLAVVPAAHVHHQEPVVFKSIDLVEREHGFRPVFDLTLLLHPRGESKQNGLELKLKF